MRWLTHSSGRNWSDRWASRKATTPSPASVASRSPHALPSIRADLNLRAVRITAKVDYAVRAVIELAAADGSQLKGEQLADRQAVPLKYLENILADLRRAGIVRSQRGADGGYRLAKPADEVTVADVIRAVEGPLADVHGTPPEEIDYPGAARPLRDVGVATRAALRTVLETVTVADIANADLPRPVGELVADPEAWIRRRARR